MRKILIGGAWPYANGSLHIGHVAGLLPGDVLARYHRAAGDQVWFVSGSDCHGTPVAIRAKQEGKTPREISDHYHEEFTECFEKLGFSYDCYTKTSSREHIDFIQRFHKKLYESPYVYEKESPQAFCECCNTFLADRFVTGLCPKCGAPARGDQCDECGTVLEPENLEQPVCAVCGKPIQFKTSKHLYIAISKLEKELKDLVDKHPEWRKNAIAFTNKYISEGLRDRALTRDLEWGIPVPKEGYENKTIYIWAENVLGYLSASEVAVKKACAAAPSGTSAELPTDVAAPSADEVAKRVKADHAALWDSKDPDSIHYYVHGKDNIPFHTIILPSLLIANGEGWRLPDRIISSEYLTLEGRKISTSRNYAIWLKDLLDQFDADSIRYYFLANGPEKRDADFSWNDYVLSHNGELLGAYGNFVNRTLAFVTKYYDGIVPSSHLTGESLTPVSFAASANVAPACGKTPEEAYVAPAYGNISEEACVAPAYGKTPEEAYVAPACGKTPEEAYVAPARDKTLEEACIPPARGETLQDADPTILARLKNLYASVGKQIEAGNFRDAIREIFEFVHFANKYFDAEQPWITRTTDPVKCGNTIFQCVRIIANLAALLAPFLPFSSEKISRWLGTDLTWEVHDIPAGHALPATEILFQRIDKKVIEEETAKLKSIL